MFLQLYKNAIDLIVCSDLRIYILKYSSNFLYKSDVQARLPLNFINDMKFHTFLLRKMGRLIVCSDLQIYIRFFSNSIYIDEICCAINWFD